MGKIFIIKKTPKQVKLWHGTYSQQGQDKSAHQTERYSVIKQDSRTAQIPPQSFKLKEELEEVKSIINNATSIKKAILKVKPDLCKNKANLPRQPRRQAAFQAAESILAILSEEAKRNKADAKEIFLAKRARTDNTVLDDKVRTENEAVEIVLPVEEARAEYEAPAPNVSEWDPTLYNELEEWLSKENEAVEIVVPVEEARAEYEAPAPNVTEWDRTLYDEIENWLSKENEAVEIVVPVEEKTNNYEAAKELVITNKVPREATAAVTISENTEKQTLTETPVPNLSEWEIYNELDKYLDGKLYC